MNAGLIDADGNVNLYFNHASDYTIVVSDKVMDGSNNATDTVKDSANDSLNGTPTTGDKIPIVLIVVLGIVGAIGVAYCKRQI